LLKHIAAWLGDEGAAFKRYPGAFRGAAAKVESSQSPGLMLIDLMLRDVKCLFSDLPGLLQERSSTKLILPIPQGEPAFVMSIKGRRLKAGHLRPLSPELGLALKRATPNSMLPLYADRLADMKISYHAAFGELRTVSFRTLRFEDMLD
jgi:hypothetical protein